MLKLDLLQNDRILILIQLFLLSVWDEYCHVFEDNTLHSFSFMSVWDEYCHVFEDNTLHSFSFMLKAEIEQNWMYFLITPVEAREIWMGNRLRGNASSPGSGETC